MPAIVALLLAFTAAPLPDLHQEPPHALSVVERHGRLLLVFGSAVDNLGPGELVVVGRREGRGMRTWQVVGGRRYPLPVRLRYVHAETHEHWHFPDFERYELRRLDGTLVGRDRKTGFCLRDRYPTPAALDKKPVWTGQCRRGHPEARTVSEGISVGFGDDYVPEKEGQSIDVTGGRAGSVRAGPSSEPRPCPPRALLREQCRLGAGRAERPPGDARPPLPGVGPLRHLTAVS
jgi:Lysyl oxidase